MSQRKPILTITYHSDDDTGMYEIGELDCGLGDDLVKYVKSYGIDDLLFNLKETLPRRITDFIEYQNKLDAKIS